MQGARPISRNSILDFGVDSGSRALSAREFAIQFDIAVIEFAHANLKRFVWPVWFYARACHAREYG